MSQDSSMKLALCLSGQPRSYRKAYEYIHKNLLNPYCVDVFAHAWRPTGSKIFIFSDIQNLYKPVLFTMEESLPENINSDLFVPNASHPANFCTSMFYSIFRSDILRTKTGAYSETKYDFVVRSRFDIALNKVIDFKQLKKGVVYVPKDIEDTNALLNDQFAIADPDTMSIYSSTYLFLKWHASRGVPLCGHAMLEAQLKNFNIPVERLDIDHPFNDGKFNIGRHSIIRDDMNKWVDIKIWGY